MCIRDRYNTYSFLALYANVDKFTYTEAEIPLTQRPEIDRWIISVSYTHLRAHETVLDLVCRLLLEKKKTKPQTKPLAINKNKF